MKALAAAVTTLIFAVVLVLVAGCTSPQVAEGDSGNGGMYQDTWHKMPDGRTVYCLYKTSRGTGYADGPIAFECDFAGATVHQ